MIKEAQVLINGQKINVAIVHGAAAFKEMFGKLQGKKQYHLVEMMTCPGGCINGSGLPFTTLPTEEVIAKRSASLGLNDSLPISNPTHNKLVKKLYNDDLTTLLHTVYSQKEFTKE